MSHNLAGFAATTNTLQRLRRVWYHSRIFQLRPGTGLAFLPIPDWYTIEQENAAGRIVPNDFAMEQDFHRGAIDRFAADSVGSGLAWLRTNYFMGLGYQVAILWIDGAHVFGPDVVRNDDKRRIPVSEYPINRALRSLGVMSTDNFDEFDIFGLGGYSEYKHIAATAEEVVPPG
jgi:hypothetical protein